MNEIQECVPKFEGTEILIMVAIIVSWHVVRWPVQEFGDEND